jgi:hypothetical protein
VPLVSANFGILIGQRSSLAPNLGDQSPGVDGAMDDVRGGRRASARVSCSRDAFSVTKITFGILRPALELVLQLERRCVVSLRFKNRRRCNAPN